MIAGRVFKTDRYRIKYSASASGTHSGDGTGIYGHDGGISAASIFNSVSLDPGVAFGYTASSTTNQASWAATVPGSFNVSGTTSGWSSISCEIHLVGLAIYSTNSPTWYLVCDSTELYINGALHTTGPGLALGSTGFAPCYLPLIGTPVLMECRATGGTTGVSPASEHSFSSACSVSAIGGWDFKDEAGSWVAPPVSVPTSTISGYGAGGIVGGSNTGNVTLAILDQHAEVSISASGAYYKQNTDDTAVGYVYIVPDQPRSVVRMDENDYGALVYRGGFPLTNSETTHNYGPTSPPSTGGPYPNPYFRTDSSIDTVHPSRSHVDPAVVEEGAHSIENPMTTSTPMAVNVARSHSVGQWISEYDAPPNDRTPPGVNDGVALEAWGFEFPRQVQPRDVSTEALGPNPDILPYLNWGITYSPQTWEQRMILYAHTWCSPHWSYFLWPLGDLWNVGGGTVGDDYWFKGRQQVLGSPGGRRTHVHAEPWDQGGDVGFVEAITGRKGWWWGGQFDLRPLTRPTEKQLTASGLYHGDGEETAPSVSGTTVTLAAGRTAFEIDLGSWSLPPYMYVRTCDRVRLALPSGSNVATMKAFLVADDAYTGSPNPTRTKIEFTLGTNARLPWGKSRAWWITGGLEFEGDTYTAIAPAAADKSALFALSPDREGSPPLAPARMGVRLRIEVEAVDDSLPCLVTCPVFVGAPLVDSRIVPETARYGAILTKDGPSFRFGTGRFFDTGLDLPVDDPIPESDSDRMPLVGDGIAFTRAYLEGVEPIGSYAAECAALYDAGIEYTTAKALWRDPEGYSVTHSFLAPGSGYEPIMCLVNSYRAVPPSFQLPSKKRTRANDWAKSGALGLYAYSHSPAHMWLHAPKNGSEMRPRLLRSGIDILSDASAGRIPDGWGAGYHELVTTGNEGLDATIDVASGASRKQLALVRPWRGYGAVWGQKTAGASVHLTTDWHSSLLLRTLALDGDVTSHTDADQDEWDGAVGEGDSAQAYVRADGLFATFYSRDGMTYRAESYDQGETWTETDMALTGSNPAVATEKTTAIEVVAIWDGDAWTLFRRLPGENDFTEVGEIVDDAPEGQGGLVFDPAQDGVLRFDYFDGTDVQSLYSRNHGDTWTSS